MPIHCTNTKMQRSNVSTADRLLRCRCLMCLLMIINNYIQDMFKVLQLKRTINKQIKCRSFSFRFLQGSDLKLLSTGLSLEQRCQLVATAGVEAVKPENRPYLDVSGHFRNSETCRTEINYKVILFIVISFRVKKFSFMKMESFLITAF